MAVDVNGRGDGTEVLAVRRGRSPESVSLEYRKFLVLLRVCVPFVPVCSKSLGVEVITCLVLEPGGRPLFFLA